MGLLATIFKALMQGVLDFIGKRLERRDADQALRELGARQAEAKWHESYRHMARNSADERARPVADDDELDRRLRAPADRNRQSGE